MATDTRPPARAAAPWNLNRLLVVLGSFSVLLAGFAFVGWSLTGFAGALLEFVPALPGWIFAIVLAFYARPWVYLAAGILNAVLPLMVLLLFGAIFGLTQPLAGPEYQSVMLLLIGLVFSLWGGISGFVQGRKDAHTPLAGALSTPKGAGSALLAIFLLGALVTSGMASSAVKDMIETGSTYNVVPEETRTLTTAHFVFEPRELQIPVGKLVEVRITNADAAGHTFTYEAGGRTFDTYLPGGATTKVLLRFDEPQRIPFWCKPHSAGAGDADPESMTGMLVVA
ncbi:MAG TPA: cupredoxin domain-containing protein [Candidatus Thermoplasmatota archaeon]|nr:cupredoxin domain-containing protein [Candidatus Thermoplasmatota archaeon]